jgi:hypothetical protein
MDNFKNHKKSYIVAAVVLIALIFGGLSYSGFDFSKLTGALVSGGSYKGTTGSSAATAVGVAKPALKISATNTPSSDILSVGSTHQLVSRYAFAALNGDVTVNKLTVMNDFDGNFDSFYQPAVAAINVTIQYPNASGAIQAKTFPLSVSNGTVTFTGLNFGVPRGVTKNLDIYVDVGALVNDKFSGELLRFGIQDTLNTTATFEAVSASGQVTTSFSGSSSVQPFAIRKSKPVFASASVPTVLKNGENTLYGLNITAQNGDVSFGRLVFDVTTFGLKNKNIHSFHLYSGTAMIPDANVNIIGIRTLSKDNNYYSYPIRIQTSTLGLDGCDGTFQNGVEDGTYQVIVSFNTDEKISKSTTQTYYLKATVVNPELGSTITTKLNSQYDNSKLINLTSYTGKIFVQDSPRKGIFLKNPLEFTDDTGPGIIWSDRSDATHSYPTLSTVDSQTSVASDTGSSDWTNGYLLKTSALPAVTLSY